MLGGREDPVCDLEGAGVVVRQVVGAPARMRPSPDAFDRP
jgi:hypothetical protein